MFRSFRQNGLWVKVFGRLGNRLFGVPILLLPGSGIRNGFRVGMFPTLRTRVSESQQPSLRARRDIGNDRFSKSVT